MQFSVMYVKIMGVNNDSGVVHNTITRCQVQRWYMLVRWRVFSVDTELSEDGHYTTTKRFVCHMVCQIFKWSKYPVSFQMSVQR